MFSLNSSDAPTSESTLPSGVPPMEQEFSRARDLRESGDLESSCGLLTRTFKERKRVLGLDDDHTQVAASQLGRTLRAMGDFEGAIRLHRGVLEFRTLHYGHAHSFTLNSAQILADTYLQAGEPERARELKSLDPG
ncbi:MAG: hypothetical protein ACI8QS_003140 [Planctomycetota bacterium]|jgi:hypothetical protein